MAGETLYVPVHYYEAIDLNGVRQIVGDLGAAPLVLPHIGTVPSTGQIVSNGMATELFTAWGNAIPNFQAAGSMMVGYSMDLPRGTFVHYFPAVRPVAITNQFGVENMRNGHFFVTGVNYGATGNVYSSRAAFLAGAAPIASSSGTYGFFYFKGSDLIGERRGRAELLCYSDVDENGNLTGLRTVNFEGTTSTTSSVWISGVSNRSLVIMDALLGDTLSPYTPGAADPYEEGGPTVPGGGGGDYIIRNDPIDFPELPSISVAEAGFVSIWTPELSELRRLASFMWCADPLKIEFWKQMISNPIDLILGLQILPFDIPADGVGRVTLGLIDSKIDMHYTDQQFHEIDCGELELAEYWGAFLDYGPFTGLDIFLPFIGVRSLNINDCMPKTIRVKYRVDIVTGTCVALVKCDDSVFYHFNGSCAAQVPVTSGQAQQLFGQALSSAIKIATGAATGGIAGALASTVGVASAAAQSGGAAGADRSGSISGTAGFMDNMTPYLIVTRPRQAVPEKQNTLTGYPSFITAQLGELDGYTEVQVTHLHNMSCTAAEVEEIMQLLQEGVIF